MLCQKYLKVFVQISLFNLVFVGPLPKGRIIGGYDAVDGQFPYMISIRGFPAMNHNCGGSIINEFWVLTATHCIIGANIAAVRVFAGSVLQNGGENPVTYSASRIVVHPDYDEDIWANDVGLIRIVGQFVWTRNVQPIRLGTEFIGGGVPAVAMGWGFTSPDWVGWVPNNLQWFNTQTTSVNECRERIASWVFEGHICSFSRSGQGICLGDSGGPLVVGDAVVGIASFVTTQCASGAPDGWERVSYYHSWIVANAVD